MSYTRKKGLWSLMVMGLLTVTAWQVGFAADSARSSPAHTRGGSGFLARLDRSVGLTPEQRDAVHGLLAAQRQSSQELREQTDAKIRAALTPVQQKKFDDFLAHLKSGREWHPSNG